MRSYSMRDVQRVLRLSADTTRNLIKSGFVKPARGARREYRFSFQYLIVLRTARALFDAKIPARRIRRSLESLRRELPSRCRSPDSRSARSAITWWCAMGRRSGRSTAASISSDSMSVWRTACCGWWNTAKRRQHRRRHLRRAATGSRRPSPSRAAIRRPRSAPGATRSIKIPTMRRRGSTGGDCCTSRGAPSRLQRSTAAR
ncbi:MAG: MerR family transcriptional regulator [Gammaproteobacteria bacterium]|nr:MerR family transcriptional regulator [Gammaproteobacteria bacterium]